MIKKHFISWDLGGTKCAAGLIEFQSEKNTYTCLKKTSVLLQEATSLHDLVMRIESDLGLSLCEVDAICIGAAGMYNGHSLILANAYPYPMPFFDLAQHLKWPNYAIIHDYATVLCGTFTQYLYSSQHVKRLNSTAIPIFERRLTFGIGTGLGGKDGLLLENGDFWLGTNEIGFIGLPALLQDAPLAHTALLTYLQKAGVGCTVFETLLSGAGLQLLHRFFYPTQDAISPSEIGDLMQQGQLDEVADLFAWYLGLFVATLELAFMPKGGIWMTGGILMKHVDLVKRPSFKAGTHALPAYLAERSDHPLGILLDPDWPLIGAAFYANKRLYSHEKKEATMLRFTSVS